jgi:hypothetical protein
MRLPTATWSTMARRAATPCSGRSDMAASLPDLRDRQGIAPQQSPADSGGIITWQAQEMRLSHPAPSHTCAQPLPLCHWWRRRSEHRHYDETLRTGAESPGHYYSVLRTGPTSLASGSLRVKRGPLLSRHHAARAADSRIHDAGGCFRPVCPGIGRATSRTQR